MPSNPLHLERSVQIAMAAMTALGTLLLGLGQQSIFLPIVAFLAAVSSVVLCDIRKVFRLNRSIANIAALLAVAYAMTDFYGRGREDSETQLLAIANLLVYLQVVLQFQEKNLRVYWSLSVLSLLQVVVASALNLSFSFGPLLVLYLVVGLTALSLLFVYRETERFQADAQPVPEAIASIGPRRRWPLGVGQVHWSGIAGDDPGRPLVGRRMIRHVLAMGLVTLAVTVLVFYGMPRYRKRVWQGPGERGTSMVGFNDEVSLGEMRRILQNDEPVMRVKFEKMGSQLPLVTSGAPYFRGAALSDYSWHSGRGGGRWKPYGKSLADLPSARPNEADVMQEVIFLSGVKSQGGISDDVPLFSTFPVFRHRESGGDLKIASRTRQLMIKSPDLPDGGRQFRYVVRSGEFSGSQQVRLSIEPDPPISYKMIETFRTQPGLIATAARVVGEAQAIDPMAKALALEDHFRRPGNYEYDLDPDVVRTPDTDPIEDFVVNHRTGHCEYFASALVFMLRSQGIPARMVVGYHGGDFNSVGNYYLVRQKHAHAWVEAYLEPGEYPLDQLATGSDDSGRYGAWLRLDPTPPDYDLEIEDGETTLLAHMADMLDYAQLLWTDYVLGLNSQRQRDAIYGPIAAFIAFLRTSSAVRYGLYALVAACGLVVLAFAALLAARAMGLGARESVVESLVRALGLPGRWLTAWWKPGREHVAHRAAMHVAFYERLEALLKRQGLVRGAQQTQREFAAAAGGRLADVPHLQPVAGIPRRVAEAFYRVRFGGPPLDSREEQAVEQALRDLESALAQGRA